MASVLTIFTESLLLSNNFSRQASSALTTVLISSMLSEENDIAISLSYIVTCAVFRVNGISFI